MKTTYYAKCMQCKDYHENAVSLEHARDKVEQHEKKHHKNKKVGIFGKVWESKKS